MFGIGTGEILVLFILVLLIYGPQKLPELAAKLGKFSRDAKDALDEVRSAMNQPKEEVKKWGQEMMVPPPVPTKNDDEDSVKDEETPPSEQNEESKEKKEQSGKDDGSGRVE